jgi:CubicO group peptidase (beta-lactamase class C family)
MTMASLLETLDGTVLGVLERLGVPGIAVSVLAGGERRVRAHGVADLSTGEPVHPDTQFLVASITKPLVATLAMRLVEEDLLSLDEPVHGLRLPWEGVTLRHMLSHHAGLAHEWPRPLADYGDGLDALELLAGDEPAAAPVGPGELFAYSNSGYWLAGALLERAAGMPFEDALRRFVLEPLGMRRTGFDPKPPVASGHFAQAGSRDHRVAEPWLYPRARRPGGTGFFSTAEDLLAFAAHLLGGPGPLGEEALRELRTVQVEANADSVMGLGIGVSTARGRTTLEHGGDAPGFRSLLLAVPSEEAALVLLANSDRGRRAIEEVLGPLELDLRLPPEISVPAEELSTLAGTYREPLGCELVLSVRDLGLDLVEVELDPYSGERIEYPAVHLRPAGTGRFVVRVGDDYGASGEFLRGGRLLRWSSLFERVVD